MIPGAAVSVFVGSGRFCCERHCSVTSKTDGYCREQGIFH
jgi:hypothetical protein